jgi:MFS family permease
VFTGGGFFGAMAAGPIGDWLGRKNTILMGSLFFLIGGGLQTGAKSVAYLFAGRAFAGFGVGFLVMIIPIYQSEIAHPSIRGRITSLQQFMLGIGALVAAWGSWGKLLLLLNFLDLDAIFGSFRQTSIDNHSTRNTQLMLYQN